MEELRAEVARLREANRVLEAAFDTTGILIACMDRNFNFIRVNRAYAQADGKEPGFFPGKNHFVLFPYKDNEHIFRRVVATGEPHTESAKAFEYDRNPERGVSFWDWTLHPVKDEAGEVREIVLILSNATERIKADLALRKSEEFARTLIDRSPNPIVVINSDATIRYANPAFEKLTGLTSEEILGARAPYPWWTEETLETTRRDFEGAMKDGARRIEEKFKRKDGSRFWVEITSTPLKHEGGPRYYLANWVDVTERKLAEEALRESEELYRTLVDTSPDGIGVFDFRGNILKANRQAARVFGYDDPEELAGMKIAGFIAPEDAERFAERMDIIRNGGGGEAVEYTLVKKDGSRMVGEMRASAVSRGDGTPKYGMAVIRDVTERKRAEEALRESEEIYRTLVETSPNAISMTDLEGKIIRINRKAAEMLGKDDPGELIGERGYDLVVPEEREEFKKRLMESFKDGVSGDIDFTFFGQGGERRTGEFKASVITGADGKPKAAMATVTDITERKQVEEELLRYHGRLKSLATQLLLAEERERRRIATELHDEIGQTLAMVKIKLGELKKDLATGELAGRLDLVLNLCKKAIEETRSLTFELSPPVLYELGFEAALAWLAEKYSRERGIPVGFEDDREPKPLGEDVRVLLFQSVRELLNNAFRYAHARGVKIGVGREGDDIRVVVEDDGVGFDPSGLRQKEGFGLFNIHERISSVGGRFILNSAPQKGVRVILTAPLKNRDGDVQS